MEIRINWLKIIAVFVFFVLISCRNDLTNSSSVLGNSAIQHPNSNPNQIDVKHQTIDIMVDLKNKRMQGKTKIEVVPMAILDVIKLDAAELEIISVAVKQSSVDFSINEKTKKLIIQLDEAVQPTEQLTIEILYNSEYQNQSDPQNIWGSFGNGLRYFSPTVTERERRAQLWAIGEPKSSSFWMPTNDHSTDLRTTDIKITVAKPLTAFTTGTLVSTQENEDRSITYHWKSMQPYPPHHSFLVVGDYINFKQSFENVGLNNYGYPDEQMATQESVVSLPNMMKFYSDYTGLKYPYSEYSQIFVQDFGGWKGALGSSVITENMIDDKTTHHDFLYTWDLTEGEALAHQWFGSYIKPKSWNDVWLTKAFTRYLSGLYNKHKNGNTEFLTYQLSPDLLAYISDWNSGLNTTIVPDTIDNIEAFVNGNAPSVKGARVLHMLRIELGKDKWQKLVKTYVSKFGNKLVTTHDFIEVTSEIAGKSMNWFFEQWVYSAGHPIFELTKHYDTKTKELVLSAIQKQSVDSVINGRHIPFFKGKMRLEIDDKIEEVSIEAKMENIYKFSMKEEPSLINFDFEDVWIKESYFEKSSRTYLNELEQSKDALHRVYIMQKLTAIAQDSATSNLTVLKIKKALRNASLNEAYWRMRLIAVGQLTQISAASMINGKVPLDSETEQMLMTLVDREKSWSKAWAINFLGTSRDKKYVPLYKEGLKDYSDRVVFMSAIALGKTKDKGAFESLMKLPGKPSWKNQSLISALYGLKELEDPRAYDLAIKSLVDSDNPHWNLGTPIWDHRLAAAHTLVAIGKADHAYPLIFKQFENAMEEGHVNDIFYNALLVSILGDERGKEVFEQLKRKYDSVPNALKAINQLETNFLDTIQ